jgi:hypothetical protein
MLHSGGMRAKLGQVMVVTLSGVGEYHSLVSFPIFLNGAVTIKLLSMPIKNWRCQLQSFKKCRDCIHDTSFSSKQMNGPNKLEYLLLVSLSRLL